MKDQQDMKLIVFSGLLYHFSSLTLSGLALRKAQQLNRNCLCIGSIPSCPELITDPSTKTLDELDGFSKVSTNSLNTSAAACSSNCFFCRSNSFFDVMIQKFDLTRKR